MFLHKTGKKIMALLLAMAIVLSGIIIVGNPIAKKDFVKFGNEVKAVTAMYYYTQYYTKLENGVITRSYVNKSDILVPDGTYPDDGVHTDGYWYVKGNKATFEEKWTQKQSAPVARDYASTVVINNKIYVFGGDNESNRASGDLWEYDLEANSWTQKASGPCSRYGHTSVAINDKMYVFGGHGDYDYYQDLWEYDPSSNKWVKKADAPSVLAFHSAVVLNNKMYVFGGSYANGVATFSDSVMEYDPASNKWTKKQVCHLLELIEQLL